MKLLPCLSLLLVAFFAGCTTAPHAEKAQLDAPARADLVGQYSIIEETASGLTLEQSKLGDARLELGDDGSAKFTNFPRFDRRVGAQRVPTRFTENGRWLITSDPQAYYVDLIRANNDRLRAVVAEGGNPSDLIIYYTSREAGSFVKLRKL